MKKAIKSFSVATHLFRVIIFKIRKSLRWGTPNSVKLSEWQYVQVYQDCQAKFGSIQGTFSENTPVFDGHNLDLGPSSQKQAGVGWIVTLVPIMHYLPTGCPVKIINHPVYPATEQLSRV